MAVTIKLLPTNEQAYVLRETLERANEAANAISEIAWENNSFGQYKLHKLAYHETKARFDLSSQMIVRAISKVADAYKLDRKRKRDFKPLGAIAYDDRILRYYDDAVSIWTIEGRQHIPYVCDERTEEMLKLRQGESNLLYRDGKWYLLATVNIEEPPARTLEDWLGIDLGIASVATDSDGEAYSGSQLKILRHRYARIRSRLQAKKTKSARRLLKRRRRKEKRMARNINHAISKSIVSKAQGTDRGIALEDLKGIRERMTVRRRQRRTMHSWSFHQLRRFVEYKARLAGVAVRFVDPRNTSRTCPKCGCVDKRNRSSQDTFECVSCGFSGVADAIAAENIRRAAVDQPNVVCESISHNYKPPALAGGS